jgi:predicted flap endonuclease-1-like 5' DNA nuclease
MYVIMQILLYLLLAAIIGGFIAWAFGMCNCNSKELQAELDGARAERDELAARLGARQAADSGRDVAVVSSLEAQLEEARAKIAQLEAAKSEVKLTSGETNLTGGALGLAGAGGLAGVGGAALAGANANGVSIDKDELETLTSRNKYLEARIKFLEENAASAKANEANIAQVAVPKEEISNANFEISAAGAMSPEELEAEIVKAGDGVKPKSAIRSNEADDLLLIDGVGPKNNAWLNENGIHYFWQIATMSPAELAWLANNLPNFGSRVYRENWVSQCANLAKGLPPR